MQTSSETVPSLGADAAVGSQVFQVPDKLVSPLLGVSNRGARHRDDHGGHSNVIFAEAPAVREHILQEALKTSAQDSIIAAKTLEEVQKGWASEPLDPHTLEADALVNRRFAILQKGNPK